MAEILTVFGVDGRLLIVQMVNFAIALFILWYFLYTPLISLLDKRQTMIEESVRKASEVDAAHAKTEEDRKSVLTEANSEADGIIARAREHAKKEEHSIVGEAHNRSEQIIDEARARSEEDRRRVLSSADQEIAKLAVLAAEKVLRQRS